MPEKYELFLDKNKKVKLSADEEGNFFAEASGKKIKLGANGLEAINEAGTPEAIGGGATAPLEYNFHVASQFAKHIQEPGTPYDQIYGNDLSVEGYFGLQPSQIGLNPIGVRVWNGNAFEDVLGPELGGALNFNTGNVDNLAVMHVRGTAEEQALATAYVTSPTNTINFHDLWEEQTGETIDWNNLERSIFDSNGELYTPTLYPSGVGSQDPNALYPPPPIYSDFLNIKTPRISFDVDLEVIIYNNEFPYFGSAPSAFGTEKNILKTIRLKGTKYLRLIGPPQDGLTYDNVTSANNLGISNGGEPIGWWVCTDNLSSNPSMSNLFALSVTVPTMPAEVSSWSGGDTFRGSNSYPTTPGLLVQTSAGDAFIADLINGNNPLFSFTSNGNYGGGGNWPGSGNPYFAKTSDENPSLQYNTDYHAYLPNPFGVFDSQTITDPFGNVNNQFFSDGLAMIAKSTIATPAGNNYSSSAFNDIIDGAGESALTAAAFQWKGKLSNFKFYKQ